MLIYFTNSFVIIFLSLKYPISSLNTKIYRSSAAGGDGIENIRPPIGLHFYLASMHSAGCCGGLAGEKPGGSGMLLSGMCGPPQPSLPPHGSGSLAPPPGCWPSWLKRAHSSCCCGDSPPAPGGGLPKFTDVDMMAGSICVQSLYDAVLLLYPAIRTTAFQHLVILALYQCRGSLLAW